MSLTKIRALTPEQQETLRTAREIIRAAYYGEFAPHASNAHSVCDKLSALIGERYSFRSGEVLEPPRPRR